MTRLRGPILREAGLACLTFRDIHLTVGDRREFDVPTRFGRSAGLTGYIELARAIGVDPYRMASSIGLPANCLTNPDLKIPADAIGRLLEATAQRSGAEDIGLRLAES